MSYPIRPPKVPVDMSTGKAYLPDMDTTTATTTLHPAIVVGSRIAMDIPSYGITKHGTVTRVLDREGARGGLVEVRWDGEKRPRRGAGFELGDTIRPE